MDTAGIMEKRKKRPRHPEENALMKTLGDTLKQLRKYHKRDESPREWTLHRIAEKIDISVAAYQKIEAGKSWPRPHHLVRLARLYGHSIDALLKIKRIFLQEEDDIPGSFRR